MHPSLKEIIIVSVAAVSLIGVAIGNANAGPPEKGTVSDTRGNTIFTSRDEDGRTRTRIIIQKRSYLDPGTEALPGSNNQLDYMELPGQRASDVLDGTAFGSSQTALPGPFTLPGKNNPF
jgi:hypothetical protein